MKMKCITCWATTASCGSSGSGAESKACMERRAVFKVSAGLHWSFKMSKQMAPLWLLMFGCLQIKLLRCKYNLQWWLINSSILSCLEEKLKKEERLKTITTLCLVCLENQWNSYNEKWFNMEIHTKL